MQKALSNLHTIVEERLGPHPAPEMALKLGYFVISLVRLPHALSHHVFWSDVLATVTLAIEQFNTPNQFDGEFSRIARECLG